VSVAFADQDGARRFQSSDAFRIRLRNVVSIEARPVCSANARRIEDILGAIRDTVEGPSIASRRDFSFGNPPSRQGFISGDGDKCPIGCIVNDRFIEMRLHDFDWRKCTRANLVSKFGYAHAADFGLH
jgi:hypothetical protein